MQTEQTNAVVTKEEAAAQWEQYFATRMPLKKHSYPALIKLFFVVMLCLLVYSFISVPRDYKFAKMFKRAGIYYQKGDIASAYENMAVILNAGFYSTKTRVLMARILLSTEAAHSDNDEDHLYERALGLLYGLQLDKKTYDEILKLMPPKYFEQEKADEQPKPAAAPAAKGGKK
ncbi:MAG: hypothetical protein FWF35_03885 [Elusimicrobia bacterium]|nr:hypothetical protein [Elusimicrobiota bacterium]